MESFTPGFADRSIATTGAQTIHYTFSGPVNQTMQRIDRHYEIDEYWDFGRPLDNPMNVSLITRIGLDGFSCYVRGNENLYLPEDATWGYTDRESLQHDEVVRG